MDTLLNRPLPSHLHLPRLRPAKMFDAVHVQEIWSSSQEADDPGSRPRDGWWSIMDWATTTHTLLVDGTAIGLAAVNVSPGDRMAEGRLALLPARRTIGAARHLVQAALDLADLSGAERLRLVVPGAARWAGDAASDLGFQAVRATHVMLRPSSAGPLPSLIVPVVRVRPLRPGEEPKLLDALNRSWAGTWGFTPIPASALERDLRDQRDGMQVAVDGDDDGQIVATVHAMFDPTAHNLDGGPYAWISNLTTDPSWRGRSLGRLMLRAGIQHLQDRGAGSVMLGVDGGNDAALRLYRSAGFRRVSTTNLLERPVRMEKMDA